MYCPSAELRDEWKIQEDNSLSPLLLHSAGRRGAPARLPPRRQAPYLQKGDTGITHNLIINARGGVHLHSGLLRVKRLLAEAGAWCDFRDGAPELLRVEHQ